MKTAQNKTEKLTKEKASWMYQKMVEIRKFED